MTVHLALGDITRAEVDAVVNAANEGMLGGGNRAGEHVDGVVASNAHVVDSGSGRSLAGVERVRCGAGRFGSVPAGE